MDCGGLITCVMTFACIADPPDIDMTRSFGQEYVLNELCDVMPPMIVARHSPAFVNFDSTDRYAVGSGAVVNLSFPSLVFTWL